jgi:hypothetical protein
MFERPHPRSCNSILSEESIMSPLCCVSRKSRKRLLRLLCVAAYSVGLIACGGGSSGGSSTARVNEFETSVHGI